MNPVNSQEEPAFSSPSLANLTDSLPNYIDYSNDTVIPLPGLANHTLMYCFPIPVDYDKALAICNKRLNFSPLSQTTRYYPLVSEAIMVLYSMEKACTLDKSYQKVGLLSEVAVQILLPVVECTRTDQDEWVAQRLLAFIPYIFVDNPFSDITGREQVGFPKNVGKFKYPATPQQADSFEVSVFGYQQFDPQKLQFPDYFPWLTIRKTADKPVAAHQWTSSREAWVYVKDSFKRIPTDPLFIKKLGFYIHELEDLFRAEVPMVFLKQFRDIADPQKACYQAINEADGRVQGFHGGWFLNGEFTVTFHDMASYPVKTDLGLPDTLQVKDAFWVDVDLLFDTGRTIWKAS